MGREDWEAIERETIEGVIENTDYPVAGYCDRRNGGFYLTSHEVFWSHGHAADSVVLDPADGEAVIARAGITIAVNIIDIPVVWIYGGVVHPAEESIDGTELGSWLGISPLATMIPPPIPFSVHVVPPSVERLSM